MQQAVSAASTVDMTLQQCRADVARLAARVDQSVQRSSALQEVLEHQRRDVCSLAEHVGSCLEAAARGEAAAAAGGLSSSSVSYLSSLLAPPPAAGGGLIRTTNNSSSVAGGGGVALRAGTKAWDQRLGDFDRLCKRLLAFNDQAASRLEFAAGYSPLRSSPIRG